MRGFSSTATRALVPGNAGGHAVVIDWPEFVALFDAKASGGHKFSKHVSCLHFSHGRTKVPVFDFLK
eukprot:6111012-Amphidinium_carterae.1